MIISDVNLSSKMNLIFKRELFFLLFWVFHNLVIYFFNRVEYSLILPSILKKINKLCMIISYWWAFYQEAFCLVSISRIDNNSIFCLHLWNICVPCPRSFTIIYSINFIVIIRFVIDYCKFECVSIYRNEKQTIFSTYYH